MFRRKKPVKDRSELKRRKMSLRVFKRDGFRCRVCGREITPLNAHHLIPWSHSLNLRADIYNLVTVCEECHLSKCHNGSFRKLNLELSAKLLLENIRRVKRLPNKRYYLAYFKKNIISDTLLQEELMSALTVKRVRARRRIF